MCGVLGILKFDESAVCFDDLRIMAAMQRHRGPDDAAGVLLHQGRLGFGHARLSIIDKALGAQPMVDAGEELWITFNGELYDHRALREDLRRKGIVFRTDSDTEVILGLYRHYGLDFVRHMNGEFAFALWDARSQRLILARDRLGIKPLFIFRSQHEFLFSSEAKAILALPRIPRRFSREFIGSSMLSVFASGVSPFEGMETLPPAHLMVMDASGKTTVKEYWRQSYSPCVQAAGEADEELREIFSKAVRRRMVSDVPLCGYLSGGIDSTIVLGTMSRLANREVTAFNVGFTHSPFDESASARAIADHHGVRFETIHCPIECLAEHVEDCIYHTEMYLVNPSAIGKFLLSRHVNAQGFRVALTGEGADEVFAGYPYFKLEKLWQQMEGGGSPPALLKRFQEIEWRSEGVLWNRGKHWRNSPRYFHFPSHHHLRALEFSRRRDAMIEVDRNGLETRHTPLAFFDRDFGHLREMGWDSLQISLLISRAQLSGYVLPTLGDRVEMAHSVEGRTPFMDVELLDFSGRLPPERLLKLDTLREKHILHTAFRGLLPDVVRHSHKHPFFAPSFQRLGRTPRGKALVDQYLSRSTLNRVGVFRPSFVRKMALLWNFLPQHSALHKRCDLFMSVVLGVNIMHQHFIEQRPAPRNLGSFEFRRIAASRKSMARLPAGASPD